MMAVPGKSGNFETIDGFDLLRRTEWIARISHRSEEAQTDTSFDRILRDIVLKHGDWSVTEHCSVTVDMYIDRGIQQELTRHRLAAYTIESTRFVNYQKKMEPSFIYPDMPADKTCPRCEAGEPLFGGVAEVSWHHGDFNPCLSSQVWLDAIHAASVAYQDLIAFGWRPQEARSVFPLALGSRVIATMNLRQWRHIFLMRTTQETHPSFKAVSIPLLKEFQEKIPILYEDIEPGARQVENLKKGR
jgi:thymidylate synthase (FAD)